MDRGLTAGPAGEGSPALHILRDEEQLALAAAELFAAEARRAADERGRFAVALSGGQTPRRTYQLLGHAPLKDVVPWRMVHVFWSDERWVAADDPRSNSGQARRLLLDHVPVPRDQVHPMLAGGSPHEAARRYEEALRVFFAGRAPRFDLVLLGMGADGHAASLFPESPALEEARRWAVDAALPGTALRRITLTTAVLNRAAVVAFLVSGGTKASALREVLVGPRDPMRLPAQLIHPADGRVLWLVDRQAAAELKRE